MSLYARYKFKQRPDAVSVRGLVAAELEDRLAPGGLPGAVHDLRRQQASTRECLRSCRILRNDIRAEYSVTLLKESVRGIEAAVRAACDWLVYSERRVGEPEHSSATCTTWRYYGDRPMVGRLA